MSLQMTQLIGVEMDPSIITIKKTIIITTITMIKTTCFQSED
jgi:hypothetical protein